MDLYLDGSWESQAVKEFMCREMEEETYEELLLYFPLCLREASQAVYLLLSYFFPLCLLPPSSLVPVLPPPLPPSHASLRMLPSCIPALSSPPLSSPLLFSPLLSSPHLTSPHLTSPHLISLTCSSTSSFSSMAPTNSRRSIIPRETSSGSPAEFQQT
eukprot:764118-Hanusia_phi.AAC.1